MDESRSDLEKNQEKLLYNVKPVNKVVNYRVRNKNNSFLTIHKLNYNYYRGAVISKPVNFTRILVA